MLLRRGCHEIGIWKDGVCLWRQTGSHRALLIMAPSGEFQAGPF